MEKGLSWITDIAWKGEEMHKIMVVPLLFCVLNTELFR